LWPMNPKPVKFLNSPCWRALHHVHIYKFKLNFTLFKGFTRRKSNRHIQKNRQHDQSFSKQWFIHKRFQEDQLRSSQNYNREQYPSSPNIVSPIPTSKTKLSRVNPRECGNPTW
jgi:hypothetical protein